MNPQRPYASLARLGNSALLSSRGALPVCALRSGCGRVPALSWPSPSSSSSRPRRRGPSRSSSARTSGSSPRTATSATCRGRASASTAGTPTSRPTRSSHGKEKTLEELKTRRHDGRRGLSRGRPGPRGRGDLLAPAGDPHSLGARASRFQRVRFNEITKKAVLAAMEDAGEIDARLVDAQQARRIIDRLVGYEVSDLLWKKIWRGLSAGRVQTVALRIICEREQRDRGLRPGRVLDGGRASSRPRRRRRSPRASSPSTGRSSSSTARTRAWSEARPRERVREDVARRGLDASRRSRPPSGARTRRRRSSRRSSSRPRRGGSASPCGARCRSRSGSTRGARSPGAARVGLITYMRTDSTRVSDDALAGVREHIATRYGTARRPARVAALLQEQARHAGRARGDPPDRTSICRPRRSRRTSPPDEAKLYRLIWERFVASQMSPAVYDTTSRRDRGGPGASTAPPARR